MVETEGRRKRSKDTDHSKLKDVLMSNGELHTHTTSEEFSVYWAIILGPLHSAGAEGGYFPGQRVQNMGMSRHERWLHSLYHVGQSA